MKMEYNHSGNRGQRIHITAGVGCIGLNPYKPPMKANAAKSINFELREGMKKETYSQIPKNRSRMEGSTEFKDD